MRRFTTITTTAALLATLAAPAPPAHAAACCMSAGALGTGRLKNWEQLAFGWRSSLAGTLGRYDKDSRWHAATGYDELEWRNDVWVLGRLARRWSLSGQLPVLLNWRRSAGTEAVGGFVGDVAVGARFDALEVGEYEELPALAVLVGVTAPTGRIVEEATQPLAVDATGRGAWVLSAGVELEKTILPWFVRLTALATVPLPRERPDGKSHWYGPGVSVSLAAGHEIEDGLVVSLALRALWESAIRVDGRATRGSERLDAGVTVALAWRASMRWTLQLAFDTSVPASGLGRNGFGRAVGTVGVRYGWW